MYIYHLNQQASDMSKLKKLRGTKVLLNYPVMDVKSKITVTPDVQAEIDKEMMKKWSSLEVYQVGDKVVDVVPGDRVYLNENSLLNGEKIEVDGQVRILVGEYEIHIVWE